MVTRFFYTGFFLLFVSSCIHAQSRIAEIETYLEGGRSAEADRLIANSIHALLVTGDPDTIAAYIGYLGAVTTELRGSAQAKKEIESVIGKVKSRFPYSPLLPSVYFKAADFFSKAGDNNFSYTLLQQLLSYFRSSQHAIQSRLYKIHSNLGTYAMRMGNYAQASSHYRESMRLFASDDLAELFILHNSMGIVLWYASKLDSSVLYFNKAIDVLKRADSTPINRYQRPAMVAGNISNVYWELGKTEESLEAGERSVQLYKLYSMRADSRAEREKGLKGQLLSSANLSVSYQNLGNYAKALELADYTYTQRLKTFGPGSPEVYKSLVALATIYYDQNEYAKTLTTLHQAYDYWQTQPTSVWFAQTNAYLAYSSEAAGDTTAAARYYQQADSLYNAIQQGDYDVEYLSFLTKAASFYASLQQARKATSIARRSLDYITANQGEASLLAAYQLCNMADIALRTGQYSGATGYAERALSVMQALAGKSRRLLDSVSIELKKPFALFLRTKARYGSGPRSAEALKGYLRDLEPAIALLERQRNLFTDEKDKTSLMADNSALLDFVNELQLELYKLTGDRSQLDNILRLRETVIYNRIRSGFDRQQPTRFAFVPASVTAEEQSLHQQVSNSLTGNASTSGDAYRRGIQEWNKFLLRLKADYPTYYQLRYGALSLGSSPELQKVIPPDRCVIRYLFIGDSLFAMVLTNQSQQWIGLPSSQLQSLVRQLSDQLADPGTTGRAAYRLYQLIWQPLEPYIDRQRVTVIPDGIIYYVSFDMLPIRPVSSYKELLKNSLLSRYVISYNYSLSALTPDQQRNRYTGIAAFVPEFSDALKARYQLAIQKDSVLADERYLSLLPLPFSVDLAKKAQQQFGGELFAGENSTREMFQQKAGGHAIIHVGTHAEANNQYPEFSRLLFARDATHLDADNSLYLYDIYNCDLRSGLSVLTACETGRPEFFPGEGMVSIAHAFNYAGSGSILTGLWRIDEQASTIITRYFYTYLRDGLPKDIALQRAKLAYISQAEGRMQAPAYWSGLVIMGDVRPLFDAPADSLPYYPILITATVVLMALVLYRRRKR